MHCKGADAHEQRLSMSGGRKNKGDMMKVVINRCFGGFSLSEAAMLAYAKRKGLTLFPEPNKFGSPTYWTVPVQERVKQIPNWMKASIEERQAYNAAYGSQTIYDRNIERNDLDLVAIVEELGEAASGQFATLAVVEIPDDVQWEIDEYDGLESVEEIHRSWS